MIGNLRITSVGTLLYVHQHNQHILCFASRSIMYGEEASKAGALTSKVLNQAGKESSHVPRCLLP